MENDKEISLETTKAKTHDWDEICELIDDVIVKKELEWHNA